MRLASAVPLLVLALSPCALLADAVPYGNGGQLAPVTPITAAATGEVFGYFYDAHAGGSDWVRLVDMTSGTSSLFLLDNQTSSPGQMADFGHVTAGDSLAFQLVNSDVETTDGYTDFSHGVGVLAPNAQVNKYLMSSDPATSFDGINHAYLTAFSGDAALQIPAGTYVGMEDLPSYAADLDYNDTSFVFTDVSLVAATPEPGSLWLLGTGLVGFAVGARRRLLG